MLKRIGRCMAYGATLSGALAIMPAVSLLALLLMTSCSATPPTSVAKPPAADNLVGAWRSSVQFSEGSFATLKDLKFLYVFNAGGTMTESSNYDGAPPVPPAYGIWRPARPNQFEATYTYYNTKAPVRFEDLAQGSGWLPAGSGVLTERLTLASDGRSFESAIVLDLYDQAGKRVEGGGHATGHGTRIHF
jgi:hypothetical protein